MELILTLLNYDFIKRALIAGVLVSLCAALLGVILVLKRYSLIGHGLGDVGFVSISISLALGVSSLYISTPLVVIAAIVIMTVSQRAGNHGDISVGIVATGALSAGVIITSLSGGFNIDVYNYMFGSILSLSVRDVIVSGIASAAMLILYVLFYNRLFLVTYDEDYARSCGIKVGAYRLLISVLTAVTVVVGMRMMGTLLISSLIIFPSVTARKLVKGFRAMAIVSGAVSVICFLAGMFMSFLFDLPTGASIAATNIIVLILVSAADAFSRTGRTNEV